MKMNLTPKQEKFAQLVASGSNLSNAYRGSYSVGTTTKPDVVNVKASQVMANGKVAVRIDVLRVGLMSRVAEDLTYGYREAMQELSDAVAFAIRRGSPAAVVAALNLKQKISGLHVEDRKNDRNPVSGMSYDQAKAALEALAAFRKAKVSAAQ